MPPLQENKYLDNSLETKMNDCPIVEAPVDNGARSDFISKLLGSDGRIKNTALALMTALSMISCSKEQFPTATNLNTGNLKYELPKESIPTEIIHIYEDMMKCDFEQSKIAYEKFNSLDSSQYVQYINHLADYLSEKYNISFDTAMYTLAKRIDYSRYLFDKMPNKLSMPETRQVGNAMENIGLPVSVNPEGWPLRYFHIEESDKVVSLDSICTTADGFKVAHFPNIVMINGKVTTTSCNFQIQQMLDNGFIKVSFREPSYMLRIEVNQSAMHMADLDFDFILDNLSKTYSY